MNRALALLLPALLFATPALAAASGYQGVVTHVTDGDTVWVRPASGGAPRQIRLQGIDAPEICQAHGIAARDALAMRVLHRHVSVTSRARDEYQRTLGQVRMGGKDVGVWMVSHGHAWSYRFHADRGPYAKHEARARAARLGLWSGAAPVPPRDFRRQHGSCKPQSRAQA
jgi:micrococcal nuclease